MPEQTKNPATWKDWGIGITILMVLWLAGIGGIASDDGPGAFGGGVFLTAAVVGTFGYWIADPFIKWTFKHLVLAAILSALAFVSAVIALALWLTSPIANAIAGTLIILAIASASIVGLCRTVLYFKRLDEQTSDKNTET